MSTDFTWPKPYLLELYSRAVEEGCIRIVMRGRTVQEREAEFKSFKAAFFRLRRRKDGDYLMQMRPEFRMVQVKYEEQLGKVLLSYNALPDGELLPIIESVDNKHDLPQPLGAVPHPTPETDPETDFDADEHVKKLIGGLDLEGGESSDEL